MKNFLLRFKFLPLILFFLTLTSLRAQNEKNDNQSGVITCSEFHITRPIREIFKENPVDLNKTYEKRESDDRENRTPQKFRFSVNDGPEYSNDESKMQRSMGNVQGRAPIMSWPGQNAGNFRPWDPTGAAGPNEYVQMVNSTTFEIYDKTNGTSLLTGSLGSLWTPPTSNAGDPIVLYDKAADRWFLAQFGSPGNKIYIAISATNDPTGVYYTYTFTSPSFPDYLKFSVWSDGYYMTSNQVQKVFCFERTAMLAGNAGARSIYTSFSPPMGSGFFVPLTGDASDGVLPPSGQPCPIFSFSDNGWGAGYSDAVNIYQMDVDWVPATPTATISLAANVPTAAFDGSYDPNWDDIPQPGTSQKLDGIGGVCMFRAQWKSFGGYNTTVLNWGVKISPTQRSIKWCELRQNQSTGTWAMYQEGIYVPDSATRWMGGIAMDNNGSIALCYMKSDATSIYPGLYYTGRRLCDPLGTLPISETPVVSGTVSQTGGNRNGDYATLALDPDGITFWHTSEYMGGTSGSSPAKTQIFSFQLANCTNIASVSISQSAGTNPQCPGSSATFTAIPDNGGSSPSYQWQVNGVNVGTNSNTFTTSSLTNGQVVSCIMTSNLPGVNGSPDTSNNVMMIVNPVVTPTVTIGITAGTNPTCSGSSVVFTATPTNGGATPSFQWKVNGVNVGTNSSIFSTAALTNGQVVSCELTSNELCISTPTASSNNITITVNAISTPTVTISQTGGTNPQCTGDPVTFTATVANGTAQTYQWKVNGTNAGTNDSTFTTSTLTNGQMISCDVTTSSSCAALVINSLGTGTTTNGSTGSTATAAAAYPTYYGNGRQQYLVLASELTTLGFNAGNINSIGFSVAGTAGDPLTLNGYSIKIGVTSSTVLTNTFLTPAFTTVLGPLNYTPVLNATNTHVFTTPFVWNGTSNIVIDICFSNQVTGNISYQTFLSTSSFVSNTYYQADGTAGANACSQATTTHTSSKRPNMIFTISSGTSGMALSNTITMTVYPQISFASITQNGDTLFTTPGFTSYEWYQDTTLISGANSFYYIASQNGDYSVIITDSNGCHATAFLLNVIAATDEIASIINGFNVRFYSGNLYLDLNSTSPELFYLHISDVIGKDFCYKTLSLKNGRNEILIPGLNISEGVYFISFFNSKETITRKIFIR